ncbi:alpha-keto acid decarboxylase family protein [Neorhodopirellula lusitana]|uniref:alpha-keto acid decarboxylase family protein n=1 Tax=Neorhodopirellula lusitana TaxID=445327 RepID=UPI00384E4AE8
MTHSPVSAGEGVSIGQYLIKRLQDYGVQDVFGIPGDYVLAFYSELEKSPIQVVGCTREDNAGFAADAYARIKGMGALCVTYCVGGLSVCNSVAGAYAEKSPVVVISGAPGVSERTSGVLLHHMVRDFRTQLDVFEKFTIASTELSDPLVAFAEIDRVLDACDRFKRPVYIELPRDLVHVVPPSAHTYRVQHPKPDEEALAEAVQETIRCLQNAKNPIIIAGVELHRFGVQDRLLAMATRCQIPIAATILGKSVISERHPLFVGLYEGALGDAEVTRFVEQSDCILLLGTILSDVNLGAFTAKLDPRVCIHATSEAFRISHHHYHLVDFCEYLERLDSQLDIEASRPIPDSLRPQCVVEPDGSARDDAKVSADLPTTSAQGLRTSEMMRELNRWLDVDTIVIADVGDALFASTELTIHDRGEFLGPAYYTSMGFSVPAALGAATAKPDHRVIVLVGDGAFQMTGQELSSLVRDGHAPIVIVLDNHGYGTERYLQKDRWDYNEIQPWSYADLPAVFGAPRGVFVETPEQFKAALKNARSQPEQLHLIHAKLEEDNASNTLKKLAEGLAKHVG